MRISSVIKVSAKSSRVFCSQLLWAAEADAARLRRNEDKLGFGEYVVVLMPTSKIREDQENGVVEIGVKIKGPQVIYTLPTYTPS